MTSKQPKTMEKPIETAGRLAAAMRKNRFLILLVPMLLVMGGLSFGVSYLMFRPDAPLSTADPQQLDTPSAPRLGGLPEDRSAWDEQIADAEANFDELSRQQNARTAGLDQRELQLRAQETRLAEEAARIKQEIAVIESVQVQTLDAIRRMNEAREALDKSRVIIAREEKANLQLLVAKYDNMETTQASEIFYTMCVSGKEDDVVRILYGMQEKKAAKILGDMTRQSDKTISARLTEKLLRVRDRQNAT